MVGHRAASPELPDSPASAGQIQLPSLVTDPVWSLKQWPVIVEVAGEDLTIPAMCAADWLHVLMSDTFIADDVFPGMLGEEDRQYVEGLLHHGNLALEDSQGLGLEIVSQVSGRPWWVALRLITVARHSWDALGGDMAEKVDASTVSLAAWLDALFLLMVRAIEDSKRTMFLMKLELAPEGWGPKPEELEISGDAFLAMAGE